MEQVVVAAKVLAAPLAKLFTVILKHGYMPQLLREQPQICSLALSRVSLPICALV